MKAIVPHDVITHKESWRRAIVAMIGITRVSGHEDDESYWRHELRAYDRMHEALEKHGYSELDDSFNYIVQRTS